jgi:LPS export ABC transporter permease LptG/LPS export ABC transporter permease LptF
VFSIFDRYVVREVLLPLILSLLLLTFLLMIPPVLLYGYQFIAKGMELPIVARVVVTLLPQALSISIPIAVLLALMIAFGRLSADREFVAMQACGVSIYRLLRPVSLVALCAMAATAYVTIVALPNANQAFREITLGVVKSQIENEVKPRVFFSQFPNTVLYVRNVLAGGSWRDVFFADTHTPDQTVVYFAREGRIVVDRNEKFVQLQLSHGTQHLTRASAPDVYDGNEFESTSVTLDAEQVFPKPPSRNAPEMTIAELRQTIAAAKNPAGQDVIRARLMIQDKYSLPVACCVMALIALALGVSNRKDGYLASFAIGFIVVFVYYVLMYMSRAAALGGVLDPDIGPWISPAILAVVGVILMIWRARSTDRPLLIAWSVRRARSAEPPEDGNGASRESGAGFLLRTPRFGVPGTKILDVYTAQQYVRIFALAVFAALGIFYISTFIDLADKLFRGSATTALLLRFFYYQTPQYVYYIIPIACLLATLVTVGLMTKNSELIVMKACGMSLYRVAAPLILLAVLASAALFGLQEVVLAHANTEAERLNGIIRGWPAPPSSAVNRWMASVSGDFYHYDFFDSRTGAFSRFTRYQLARETWRLSEVTYADSVSEPSGRSATSSPEWHWQKGWVRTLTQARPQGATKTTVTYVRFADRVLPLESKDYFNTEDPDPDKMSYAQLAAYVSQLKARGFNALPNTVKLQRKVAFPFVTIIMTLLAVPFAVTTGRRGAMYGIGIGIALSIAYWVTLNVFGAIGEGGVLTPMLAAWAPNLIFGAAALYGVLTVRT